MDFVSAQDVRLDRYFFVQIFRLMCSLPILSSILEKRSLARDEWKVKIGRTSSLSIRQQPWLFTNTNSLKVSTSG